MATKGKPQLDSVNINTLYNDVMDCAYSVMDSLGYSKSGVDYTNPKKPRTISHNEVNFMFRQVYNNLFKPSKPLFNNQKSLIDYDNIELLQELARVFIDICSMLNKSLGLMSFSYLLGCDYSTLMRWQNEEQLNPERYKILKNLQENHKALHIGLLNDSPVGALATANNDHETGLEWSKQNMQQLTTNAVYMIPAERVQRLGLEKVEE